MSTSRSKQSRTARELPPSRAKAPIDTKLALLSFGDTVRSSETEAPHTHERAWTQNYLAAHEDEIKTLAKARSQPARPTAAEQRARAPVPRPITEPTAIPGLPPVPKAPPSSIQPSSSSHGMGYESGSSLYPRPSSPMSSPPEDGPAQRTPIVRDARSAPASAPPSSYTAQESGPPNEPDYTALGPPLTAQSGASSLGLKPTQSQPQPKTRGSSKPPPMSSRPRPELRASVSAQHAWQVPNHGVPIGATPIAHTNKPLPSDVGMQRVESAPSHASTHNLHTLRMPASAPGPPGPVSHLYPPGHPAFGAAVSTPSAHLAHLPPQHLHTRTSIHVNHQPFPPPSPSTSLHPQGPPLLSPANTVLGQHHMGTLGGALTIEKPRKNRLGLPLPTRWTGRSLSQHYAPVAPPPNLSIGSNSEAFNGSPASSQRSLHYPLHLGAQNFQGSGTSTPVSVPVSNECVDAPGSYLSPPVQHASSSLSGSPSASSDLSPRSSGSRVGSPHDPSSLPPLPLPMPPRLLQGDLPASATTPGANDVHTPLASHFHQSNQGSYFAVPPTPSAPMGLGFGDNEESSDEYDEEDDELIAHQVRVCRGGSTAEGGWNDAEEGDPEGEVLLAGPAGSAAASRRPPEYDTGGGKDGPKTTWPWRHLTREVMESITKDRSGGSTPSFAPNAVDADPAASSLVVHSRFAVFAVSGSTILTAHNNKVKIFRAGTVRAEVAGITDAAMVPPVPEKPHGMHTQPTSTGTEKVATVADTPGAPSRVTALCFLSPPDEEAPPEETGRFAWVGTASGMIWELDVLKETRVAVNRMVHKEPILHIARMGRRMCVVDEGGKISTWTPPSRKSSSGAESSVRPLTSAITTAAAASNVSLSLPGMPRVGGSGSETPNLPRSSFDGSSAKSDGFELGTPSDSAGLGSGAGEGTTPGLLGTKAITHRVSVEGKQCVPLLVGDQLWVASGGVSSGNTSSNNVDATAASASTNNTKQKHSLHRSIRRGVRAAAGAAVGASGPSSISGTDLPNADNCSFHKSVRLQIYNPFADDRPFVATMVPVTLPPQFSSTPVASVTDAAIVPASTAATVFLSHTSGHISEWSRKTHHCVAVHHQCSEPILCMTAAGPYLWAGTKSGLLLVFGLGDANGRARNGRGGGGPGSRLVLIKVWPAHGGAAVTTLVTDPDSVAHGRLQVVSGGLDGAVRIWDGLLTHDWFERRLQRAEPELTSHRMIRTLHLTYNIDAAEPTDLNSSEQNVTFLRDLLRSAGRAPSVTTSQDQTGGANPIGPEIIVFGLQELIDLEDKRLTAKNLLLSKKKIGNELGERISTQYSAWRATLINAVDEVFGVGAYELVESELLVGLMTCLFVATREVHAGNIHESAVGTVKTGFFGGRYGNKGAVAARLVVDDSSLCFVNCHLAAGQSHVLARNSDAATIINTAKLFPRAVAAAGPGPGPGPASSSESSGSIPPRLRRSMAFTRGGDGEQILDHEAIFWSGDLNYRINLGRNETLRYLTSGNITALLDADQLADQSNSNARFALRAFAEAPITFPPTYKYNRMSSSYDTSAKQRTPAWCDRVLWCDAGQTYPAACVRFHDALDDAQTEAALGPAPDHRDRRASEDHPPEDASTPVPPSRMTKITSRAYRAWPTNISDHRPVSAEFNVQVKRIDAAKLTQIVPRLRQEWALVQAAWLQEAKDYFKTSITG